MTDQSNCLQPPAGSRRPTPALAIAAVALLSAQDAFDAWLVAASVYVAGFAVGVGAGYQYAEDTRPRKAAGRG